MLQVALLADAALAVSTEQGRCVKKFSSSRQQLILQHLCSSLDIALTVRMLPGVESHLVDSEAGMAETPDLSLAPWPVARGRDVYVLATSPKRPSPSGRARPRRRCARPGRLTKWPGAI
jgi:hypothetical protein